MDGDTKNWIEEATRAANKAKDEGISVLLRNDNEEIIVCSSVDPLVITALGEALACGYRKDDDDAS